MIDVRRLRTNPDEVRANLARRHIDLEPLDRAIEIDSSVRQFSAQRDEMRSQVKTLSKEVGDAHRQGDKDAAAQLSARSKELGEEEKALDRQVSALEEELRDILLVVPNEISADTIDGASEDENVVRKVVNERNDWATHQRVPHWDIGAELGILDGERAVKLSGAMFQMLRGAGARLSRALCQFALDSNADAWEEIRPPSIVKRETMVSTGHLPKFSDEAYWIERDDLWTIPTAEVPLTSMSRDETLDEADLPVQMMAHTPCFRREAGSAGKDTRGLLRVHEFDKVELMAYATPDQAPAVFEEILARAEKSMQALGFTYRLLDICAGDLGQSHHRSIDIEAYAPGCDQWLEVSSVSWYSDYQARRANVRYRPAGGGASQMVHTCNGSALPVPRVLATLLETHRQSDGSVVIPEALRPYMRGLERIVPR